MSFWSESVSPMNPCKSLVDSIFFVVFLALDSAWIAIEIEDKRRYAHRRCNCSGTNRLARHPLRDYQWDDLVNFPLTKSQQGFVDQVRVLPVNRDEGYFLPIRSVSFSILRPQGLFLHWTINNHRFILPTVERPVLAYSIWDVVSVWVINYHYFWHFICFWLSHTT